MHVLAAYFINHSTSQTNFTYLNKRKTILVKKAMFVKPVIDHI